MRANRATKSTEPPTETEQTPTRITPEGSVIKTASVPNLAMRAVGKWSKGAVRSLRRIQA